MAPTADIPEVPHAAGPDLTAGGAALLLLDVDGVLSPVGPSDVWADFVPVEDAPYLLQVSQQMADRLAALPATRAWLTSWDHLANEWVAPALGWDPLPVVAWPGGPAGPRDNDLKAQGLRALLSRLDEPPARVVWLDDVLTEGSHLRELGRQVLGEVPHLMLAPEPTIGLTADQVDEVAAFLVSDDTRPS